MKRQITAALLALFLLLSMLPTTVLAAEIVSSGKCGANVTWTLNSDGLLTIRGTGPMGNVSETNPNYTWYNKGQVKSVVIEQGVTSIGYMVFDGCGSLTSVTIPDSVTSIGIHAFTNCSSLTSVDIPSSMTNIGSRAFYHCTNLTSVTIPDGVTTIGTEAFSECVKLASVTIPGSLSNIGEKTFYKCSGLTDVTIQSGVRSIGTEAFWDCSSLTSVVIPDSVTSIGDRAFLSCSKLSNMTIPSGLTSIGERAFAGCSSLAGVTIPSGVTSIGTEAFSSCTGLTSVTILKGVKSIGEEAFRGCSSLAGVTIPDSVTSIGDKAFAGCSSLTSVTIPDSVTSIGGSAFSSTKLTSVVIPSSVNSIRGSVFNECRNLTSVVIPDSVTSIGDFAFYHCTSLRDVYYGGSEEQWNQINIVDYDGNNIQLKKATKHYNQIPTFFIVTFNSQGGSTVGSQTVISGGKVTRPTTPTRTGYIFDDWYKEEICTNPWDFWEGTVTENTTLYAKWTENPTKYTVTFNSQGGSAVSSQTLTSGGKVTKPADPTRTDYTFDGWYKEAGCTNVWNFNTDTVTKDTTLYAKWTESPTKYTVTFNSQGGSAVSSQTVTIGGKVTKPADPTRTDYTFDSWYKEANCENEWKFDTDTVTENTTLYAKWTEDTPPTPAKYTVTFDLNYSGATGAPNTQTVDKDSTVTEPTPAPIRTDYTFGGWYKEAACSNEWKFDTDTVTKNTILYAKWTKNTPPTPTEYTVTFELNGGTLSSGSTTLTVSADGKVTRPAQNPTRPGYIFVNWYTDSSCTTIWDFSTHIVTSNTTIYAKWDPDPSNPPTPPAYTVTINLDGGTLASGATTLTVNADGKVTRPAQDPTRPGYIFVNWYTDSSCTTVWDFSTHIVTSNTTIYAGWKKDSGTTPGGDVTVTINLNGGTLSSGTTTLTVNADGKVTRPAQNPTRPGYIFVNWYTDSSCTTIWDFSTHIVTSNTTIYAGWKKDNSGTTPGDVTVTINLNGGTLSSGTTTLTVNADGKVTRPAQNPTRPGYIFVNWYTDSSCTTVWDFSTHIVTSNTTIYAGWKKDSGTTPGGDVTVTINLNGGTLSSGTTTLTVNADGKVTRPAQNPTRPGYIFVNWYTDSSCTTVWDFSTHIVTSNTTIYAGWKKDNGGTTPGDVTVTINLNGGTLSSGTTTLTVNADGKVTRPAQNPTRPGYIFVNWYTDSSCTTVWDFSTHIVTSNTTIYAGWSRASAARYRIYTPSRSPGGSFSVSHTSAAQGTRVTIELSPRRDFELDLLAVTNLDTNREVRLTRRSSDEYTFTMPDSDVEVEITFEDTYSDSRSDPAPAAPQVQDRPAKWYYQNGVICHVVTGAVPTGTVLTRDMLVSVLYNLDPASSGEPSFWATSNAVVPDIYRSALYGVDKPVSREQTAMILFCYARYRGCGIHQRANLTGYADYGRIQEIARPAMSWARATGVIAGTSATRLSPQNYLTCGQAGTILSRFTTNVLWTW